MPRRIATASVGLPILLALVWAGDVYLTVAVALAAALAWTEYHRLFASEGERVMLAYGALWAVALVVGGYLASYWSVADLPLPVYVALGGGAVAAALWTLWQPSDLLARARLAVGPVYVGFLVAHAVALREAPGLPGLEWLVFALLTTFATDTGAYFVGRSIGRHRMTPSISPGKTWEGAVGGFLAAVGAGAGLAALTGLEALTELPFWPALSVAAGVGIVAQVGDLLESRLKRAAGAKDTGGLLPGHGGLLDRLDSLVLTIPLVYYQAMLGVGT